MAKEVEKPMYRVVNNNLDDDELKFFTTIDEATKEWINHLEYVWKLWKECDGISATLMEYFKTAPNPYLSTIKIIANISDFKYAKRKPSLTFTVLEEFRKWITLHEKEQQDLLIVDLKIVVFKLAVEQKSMKLFELFNHAYQLEEDKDVFIPFIQKMIAAKKFKEAAQYATALKLQKYFKDVQILLLPLIVQNKLSIVDDFVAGEPEILERLVQYLDNLIASDTSMHRQLDEFISNNKIPDVKISTRERKPLSKLIARFVKLYNLPLTICQNVNKKRNEGALHFVIRKRYVDFTLSLESWREMVHEAVKEDKDLQLDLLRMLMNVKDAKEGLYWAKKFYVPREQWPGPIVYEAELAEADEKSEGASKEETSDWDSYDNYHELNLPRDSITVVDNAEKFENFLDCGLKDVTIVGIDSEWKPNFSATKTDLAMIQIATHNRVYIIDVTTMATSSKALWTELAICLFQNINILKLGFGIAYDLKMIRDSLPFFSTVHTQGYIDIVDLWKKLVEYKFVFPNSYESDDQFSKKNLSKLVELCFGKKLNKSDQFSNWEQRPLREGQIIYAALDAYCLLEIYNVFETQCARLNIPFSNICFELQQIPYKTAKKSTMTYAKKPHVPEFDVSKTYSYKHSTPSGAVTKIGNPPTSIQPYCSQTVKDAKIPIYKWRVVCDSQLAGLITKLRICGCDTLRAPFDEALNIARQGLRIFLCHSSHFQKIPQKIRRFKTFYFVNPESHEIQLRKILKHFGVAVYQKDIFSHCKVCNSTEFTKVPKLILEQLLERFNRKNGVVAKYNYFFEDTDPSISSYNYKKIDDRRWTLTDNSINLATCVTKYNVAIRMNELSPDFLKTEKYFYVCERCGKVNGLGAMFERTLNFYKDLIIDF